MENVQTPTPEAPSPDAPKLVTEEEVIEVLRTIYDPEIPVNIYDLGLIYNIDVRPNGVVHITMTLTAPGCPVAGSFPRTIEERVAFDLDVPDAVVELTFEPPYTMDMMSEAAKLELGFL